MVVVTRMARARSNKTAIYFVLHLFSAHGLLILLIRHNIADISNRLDHRTGLTEFFYVRS